ncbi:AAA family ATPase [Micromonospora sp. NPDC049060]|uniref:AAA family ATPase n=1 Tax=Micromonospora sp. NPDC049060 TaxID=3154828 RepID=UPI0033CD332E
MIDGVWENPSVVLISGIMAAGKSTVADALARRLPRSVHLRGDVFRRMVVSGREEMTAQPSPEAWRQLRLRYGRRRPGSGSGWTLRR